MLDKFCNELKMLMKSVIRVSFRACPSDLRYLLRLIKIHLYRVHFIVVRLVLIITTSQLTIFSEDLNVRVIVLRLQLHHELICVLYLQIVFHFVRQHLCLFIAATM